LLFILILDSLIITTFDLRKNQKVHLMRFFEALHTVLQLALER